MELTLKENASTGYSWEYKSTPDANVLKEMGTWSESPDFSIPGAPGKRHRIYQGISPGQATIDLWHIQAWLAEPIPAGTFKLTVKVI